MVGLVAQQGTGFFEQILKKYPQEELVLIWFTNICTPAVH